MGVRDADGHKLGFHPERVSRWKMGEGVAMPLHAEIGITDMCNHHCKFCTLDWITHGSKTIASSILGKALTDMKSLGVKSIYLAGEGEPTLHPEFVEIVNGIKNMGLSVSLSTNGQKFTEDVAKKCLHSVSWIRFSVDSVIPEIYTDIHGVSEEALKKVLLNIGRTVEIKRERNLDVDIGVQCIFTTQTMHGLPQFIVTMRDLGVDNVQIKPCHNHPNSKWESDMTGCFKDMQRLVEGMETDDFKVVFRSVGMERLQEPRNWSRCHGFDFYVLMNANGDVVPCNIFYDKPEFIYGNIYEETFYDIWTGRKRLDIINKVEGSCFKHCGEYRCRLDVINRYLERVVEPERNDEFI
jgi:radical SAM protein with 4Fe4S-binding SPASM domain